MAGFTESLQQVTDLRPTTMHYHGIDTDQLQQHYISGKTVLEVIFRHGIATILDHQRLALEALDVRQRLDQDVGDTGGRFVFQSVLFMHGERLVWLIEKLGRVLNRTY
jgi:hypothetical protein